MADDARWVSRRLYGDAALHRLEQERVFGRSWLFLGHESQLARIGDFFLASMGEESVIVARAKDGAVHAHLNTCRHRGMPVCRADRGHAGGFTCPYHGWSYGLDGRLVGVPRERESYAALDRASLGLIPVPRVESWRGFLFGNFDAGAAPLADDLGDMAFYLDTSLGRRAAGLAVIGVQKWRVRSNWKLPAENQAGDVAHGPISHGSVFAMGGPDAKQAMDDIFVHGRNVALPNGHGLTVRVYPEDRPDLALPGEAAMRAAPEVGAWLERAQPEAVARLGPVRARLKIATATVFPNFSLLGSNFTIRVAHPRGPTSSEIWSWVFVDADAPAAVRDAVRRFYTFTFGPGGIFEQDDGENWEGVTTGANGARAIDHPFHFGMGLGDEGPDADLPGIVGGVLSEHTQRAMYRHWRALMQRP
jgi:phenylpropionate dioxygenase-like ring-hydroxylating dioxygenase large terminal subunit